MSLDEINSLRKSEKKEKKEKPSLVASLKKAKNKKGVESTQNKPMPKAIKQKMIPEKRHLVIRAQLTGAGKIEQKKRAILFAENRKFSNSSKLNSQKRVVKIQALPGNMAAKRKDNKKKSSKKARAKQIQGRRVN